MSYRIAGVGLFNPSRERLWFRGMEWIIPKYSNAAIDRAGARLVKPKAWLEEEDFENALEIVENHRAAHSFPLLVFRMGLSHRAKKIDSDVVVAQRIKRLSSLEFKLRRFPTMRLSHMQDIGGCRAVVRSVPMVRRLVASYKKSSIKHKRLRIVDYIEQPRDSGYRGVHLIYSYYSDRKPTFNGLKIEVQLRSRPQHAWATAVETIDAFTGQALKGGKGGREWQRFFALMGTYIARKEKTPIVPDTPSTDSGLRGGIMYLARTLEVDSHLQAYQATLQSLERDVKDASYYLLELDSKEWTANITGFKSAHLEVALNRYAEAEKRNAEKPGLDAVLVSAASLEELKRVYPNYLADTHVFLGILREAVSGPNR
jgi:ppGpp synthetase/RelA/SpoT-type nucleotidyltranferase